MASAVADFGEDDVPEHLLCPICFELPDREVYQCLDGHVLCKACFVKRTECSHPHCLRTLDVTLPIRNSHFEALLEDLKANCPFNSNGCKEKLTLNVMNSHKALCSYNFEKFGKFVNICKLIGFGTSCEFLANEGNTNDAVDHLVAKHGCILTEKAAFQMELTSFDEGSPATPPKFTWTPVIAKQNDYFVLIVPFIDSQKALVWLTVHLEQVKTSEVLKVEYTLRKDTKQLTYADIPLTLSKIGQSPLENDLIFSQSPFQLSWLTLNIGESLIVDIQIRKNEHIKNEERNTGNNIIVCEKNIFRKPSPPPPSRPVTVDVNKLFSLARKGDLQSFKSLVKKAPQHINIQDGSGRSLLHLTLYDPNTNVGLEKAKFLVEEMYAYIFVLTDRKETLLHSAAGYSDDKAVEYFLQKGLNINAIDALYGTPLHWACYNKKFGEANAKMILRYNPNCKLTDGWGKNPLETAVCQKMPEIANLIRKKLFGLHI